MKIQITHKLNLKSDDNWRINLHSFYNIIQVLFNEINILQNILGDSQHLKNVLDQVDMLKEALSDPQQTFTTLGELRNFKSYIFKEIDTAVMDAGELSVSTLDKLEESLINLDKVVKIIEVRTKEFLTLISHKDDWVKFDIEALEDKLREVLLTMAMRSQGRYGVTFDIDSKLPTDYYFSIKFPEGLKSISLPALFPDIIRDLAANSKKYSLPGSTISCQVEKDDDVTRLTVCDNGRGIPEEDITEVVRYGVRGSNVTPEETYGNGFGLTKAYLLTLEHNGKMWIDSVLGEYTKIVIELPNRKNSGIEVA